jgi:hypothetical protein
MRLPYGHPSPELLARLQNAGVRIFRTDRDGAVHVLTDGEHLGVTCFVACPQTASSASPMQGMEEPQHVQHSKNE